MKKCFFITATILLGSTATVAHSADEVSLIGARSQTCYSSGCYYDPNLVGEIQIKNIAYEKKVDVVYDSYFQSSWAAEPAQYQGPAQAGFEIWDFSIDDNVDQFALSFEVNGNQYWDNNNGSDYVFGTNHIIFGEGIEILVSEAMQFNTAGYNAANNTVLVYIWAKDVNEVRREVSVTYTDDNWVTVKTTSAPYIPPYGAPATGDGIHMYNAVLVLAEGTQLEDVEFAAEASLDGTSVWDNNFGHNYHIDQNGKIVR